MPKNEHEKQKEEKWETKCSPSNAKHKTHVEEVLDG